MLIWHLHRAPRKDKPRSIGDRNIQLEEWTSPPWNYDKDIFVVNGGKLDWPEIHFFLDFTSVNSSKSLALMTKMSTDWILLCAMACTSSWLAWTHLKSLYSRYGRNKTHGSEMTWSKSSITSKLISVDQIGYPSIAQRRAGQDEGMGGFEERWCRPGSEVRSSGLT